jgi:hypothetical protein
MTVVQIYKTKEYDTYIENEKMFIVLVCIVKFVKIIVDLQIHYMFLNFIIFFISFRKLENRKLTAFNRLILGIIMFHFFVSLLSSVFIFVMFMIYTNRAYFNTPVSSFVQLIAFNIFYIKDSLISLMLSYLFYFKGKQSNKNPDISA